MSEPQHSVVVCPPGLGADELVTELSRQRSQPFVLVRARDVEVPEEAAHALVAAARAPMAASASPVPAATAPKSRVVEYETSALLPPPPSLALGCPTVVVLSTDALSSLNIEDAALLDGWQPAVQWIQQRQSQIGWRHVAAPGAALAWSPTIDRLVENHGAWRPEMVESVDGPANEGLATHVLWADSRLRGVSLVIDGACLTETIHNGSQAVVVNSAKALKQARPTNTVVLAVHKAYIDAVTRAMACDGVVVVERSDHLRRFDVVYRPYQLLDPNELPWLVGAADRLMVSQLDMIAFSNPSYHPSPALFHAVRNLQRHTMRVADAVTFISEFGRDTAVAECPDLWADRLHVVSCGADVESPAALLEQTSDDAVPDGPFVLCTSATFWHKNRQHAIAVFGELCRAHGYRGSLVMVGPEPYYGRSAEADEGRLRELDDNVRGRVIHLGRVDEQLKWQLLRDADLVLYPSVIEGFGLVPFEAAAVGTASLSYSGSAIREVLGSTPATLTTWDIAEWAAAAAQVVSSGERRSLIVESVRNAASRHTWAHTAALTWEAVDATLAQPRATVHAEEGGLRSRVAPEAVGLATGTTATHFANRLVSYAQRRGSAVRNAATERRARR